MMPNDRRTALIRLLAEIDQRTAAAEDLVVNPELTCDDHSFAVDQLSIARSAVTRIEGLLAERDEVE